MSPAPTVGRVLQVHTAYRQPGGEEGVLAAERDLLERAGVTVQQVIFENADLRESRSVVSDIGLGASAIWSSSARHRVRDSIRSFRPDVVHVHNTFAAASPSVYSAASAARRAIVQTLHNYRLVCPVATTFRDGRPCTDCVRRPIPWPGVVHACVRGSRTQSAIAAATLTLHRRVLRTYDAIDRYITLTEFQRSLLVDGGLREESITVLPNFLEPDPGSTDGRRAGVLYVGRLSPEKGIAPLLQAGRDYRAAVRVAGDGPFATAVAASAESGDVTYLGRLSPVAVTTEMRASQAVVVPSLWFEGFPMVVLEAYATATPVIASRIGSLPDIVEDGITGLLIDPGSPTDLVRALRWVEAHPAEMREMGRNGRDRYERLYRGSHHLTGLMSVYAEAMTSATRRG